MIQGEQLSADEILASLDNEQRQVAENLNGPMVVLAGAGTGKTRAITHRIAYAVATGKYRQDEVLAVTFTARAAAEMKARLATLGAGKVQARTFHSAALRQLQYFWPKVTNTKLPNLVEQKAKLVSMATAELGIVADRITVRDLCSEIEWAKVSLISPEDYSKAAEIAARNRIPEIDYIAVARVYSKYEELKSLQQLIDFEDVLLLMISVLNRYPAVAQQLRDQYRFFIVDEYQDVSALQQLLLQEWLGKSKEICVVGDPSQTIYSFAGASSYHLLNFHDFWKDAAEVRLIKNYRSTEKIVSLANKSIKSFPYQKPSKPLQLEAQNKEPGTLSFSSYPSDRAEAEAVAYQISALVRKGNSASQIAILYRTNVQAALVEEELKNSGISYQIRGAERFFDRREVKEALAMIRLEASRGDVAGFIKLASDQVAHVLESIGWQPENKPTSEAAKERWESFNALYELAKELEVAQLIKSLSDYVKQVETRAEQQLPPTVAAVTLASIHAAKGLEWESVFVIGLSEGLLPYGSMQSPVVLGEEQRLLYVAITRAKQALYLSYASRRFENSGKRRDLSRFLRQFWK